jgi:hypothetical protein
MMSSLIGDRIWPVVFHVEDIVVAAVRHVWCGIVGMDAGDWAGWAQFLGATIAIIVTWWLASRESRRQRALQAEASNKDARDRIIQYDIAQDVMKDIVEMMFNVAVNIKGGVDAPLFWREMVKKMDSDIAILDKMALVPLPTDAAAINVQNMRTNSYVIRASINDAVNHYMEGNKDSALAILKDSLEVMQPFAFMKRTESAPSDIGYIDQLYDARKHRSIDPKVLN